MFLQEKKKKGGGVAVKDKDINKLSKVGSNQSSAIKLQFFCILSHHSMNLYEPVLALKLQFSCFC